MTRKILLIFLLTIPLCALGKKKNKYHWMNEESDWKRLKLEQKVRPEFLGHIDTAFVVASNRKLVKEELRYMGEQLVTDRLHYFYVYVKNGTWYTVEMPDLYTAMQQVPELNKDWLVYTEGMGKVFTADLQRGITVSSFYDVNVLLLDYPSIHPKKKSLGNYFFAIKNARNAYKYFAPVLDTLKILRDNDQTGSGQLSLLFHSMGNNVMKELVEHKKLKGINNEVWVDNLILNAPCVKQRRHRKWVNPINFAKNIYIHYNPQDRTLFLANLVSFSKQLGEQVKQPVAEKAIYINFNKIAGTNHSNFIPNHKGQKGNPIIFDHYRTLLHGGTVEPGNEPQYSRTAYHSIGWDLLPVTQADSSLAGNQ